MTVPGVPDPTQSACVSGRGAAITNEPAPGVASYPDGTPKAQKRAPKEPAISRTNAATCSGCDARWTGTSKAHCAANGCHRLFSSAATFDRHRFNGHCIDPETIKVKPRDGPSRPALAFRDGVWCSSDEFMGAGKVFGRKQ